jgi:hypothetical protein
MESLLKLLPCCQAQLKLLKNGLKLLTRRSESTTFNCAINYKENEDSPSPGGLLSTKRRINVTMMIIDHLTPHQKCI